MHEEGRSAEVERVSSDRTGKCDKPFHVCDFLKACHHEVCMPFWWDCLTIPFTTVACHLAAGICSQKAASVGPVRQDSTLALPRWQSRLHPSAMNTVGFVVQWNIFLDYKRHSKCKYWFFFQEFYVLNRVHAMHGAGTTRSFSEWVGSIRMLLAISLSQYNLIQNVPFLHNCF